MTCVEFALSDAGAELIADCIEEGYWGKDFSTDATFTALCKLAQKSNIELVDKEEWDYDRFIHECYRSCEKGLS